MEAQVSPATRPPMALVHEFALELADDRGRTYDTLRHAGRAVADVEARIIEAQFRRPDGSTLLLLNDDTPFKEMLTILLVSPSLRVLDQLRLGGAFTPGYLTSAYPTSADRVAFCWHDLDQEVTIRQRRSWAGRTRWLAVRDIMAERPRVTRERALREAAARPNTRRVLPSFLAAAWLRVQMALPAALRGRAPRR